LVSGEALPPPTRTWLKSEASRRFSATSRLTLA
jgi:hypothetical protein